MIPRQPRDVDAEWLTDRLQRVAPGVSVQSVEVVHGADATNYNATLRVSHDSATLPEMMFLKLPPLDPDRREKLDWMSMGARETRFYRDLANLVDFRVPAVLVAEFDSVSGDFLLLLEHVDGGSCVLPDAAIGVAPGLVEQALHEFATFHARFEDAATRVAGAPWLQRAGRSSDYGARLLRAGIDSGIALTPAFVAVAETYITDRDRLQDAWELGPTTILHGDAHIGNVFVDESTAPGRLGFFDWGLMTVGSPLRDVSYFLTMTLDPSVRAERESDLLEVYLAARDRAGAAAISFDDAWRWHRVQSAYTVVASCQAIVVPTGAGTRRRRFANAFVERASRAVEELNPLGALAELD